MRHGARNVLSGIVSLAMALPLAAALTTSNERQVAFATYQDIEPTVLTQMRSGAEHQVGVWMEFTNNGTSNPPTRFKYQHFTGGNATGGSLSLLTGYSGGYADPMMADNKSGVSPAQRIYATGITHNGHTSLSNAIVRWYSDNGGNSWSSASAIAAHTGTLASPAAYFMDKPTVAVSPGGTSGGYVYVAYSRRDASNGQWQIVVHVSTNGGSSWNGPFAVNAASNIFSTGQILTDSNGDVYVVWMPLLNGNDELRVAKAAPYNPGTNTLTFGSAATITTGAMREGTQETVACGTGCVLRAASVVMAKLDAAHDRIGVVWHEQNGSGGTVVQFRPIDISGASPSWGTGVTIPWNGGHDLQPALDFDPSGGFLVPFYALGMNQPTYYQVARYIYFSGSTPVVEDAGSSVHLLSNTQSSVLAYPTHSGWRLLGEYHDVSYSNGTFKTIGIQIGTYGNPYMFTTTHN